MVMTVYILLTGSIYTEYQTGLRIENHGLENEKYSFFDIIFFVVCDTLEFWIKK